MVNISVSQTEFKSNSKSVSINNLLTRLLIDLPLSILYFVCLAISYHYLTMFFGYAYFEYIPNPSRIPLIATLLIASAMLVPSKKTVQSFTMSLFAYSLWFPVLVWYGFGGATNAHVALTGVAMILLRMTDLIKVRRPVFKKIGAIWFVVFTIIFGSFVILWAIGINGIGGINFRIYDVYLFRRDAAENLPSIFKYIWPQIANAILPIALAICLAKKRKVLFILLCGVAFFLFATLHHKGILFTPVFLLIIHYLLTRRNDWLLFKLGFVAASAVGAVEATILSTTSDFIGPFNVLISRRVLLIPAQLDGLYLEFFNDNIKYYWSQSRITFGLLQMPYDDNAPKVIGSAYFGDKGTSSNTGFIGTGFANAGLLGVLAYAVIIGCVLSILESHAKVLGHSFIITGSLLIIHNALTASDLITLMLTGGFVSLVLLLSFLKRIN